MSEYGEPWSKSQETSACLYDRDGEMIATAMSVHGRERIIACINALAGIQDPADYIQRLVDKVARYRNLSILLGAKPDQLDEGYDRELGQRWDDREAETARLRAIVDKLHRTEDGVPIVPDGMYWRVDDDASGWYIPYPRRDFKLYFSRDAAEAAKEGR